MRSSEPRARGFAEVESSSMSLMNELLGAAFLGSYFVLASLIYRYVINADEE